MQGPQTKSKRERNLYKLKAFFFQSLFILLLAYYKLIYNVSDKINKFKLRA